MNGDLRALTEKLERNESLIRELRWGVFTLILMGSTKACSDAQRHVEIRDAIRSHHHAEQPTTIGGEKP